MLAAAMKMPPIRRVAGRIMWFALLAVAAACSSSAPEAAPETPTTTVATTTSAAVTTSTAPQQVSTTIERVPSSELTSVGHVTVGSVQYDFAFECWAAGASDILALGVGEDPESDELTQAIVQAFTGQAYVSVLIGDDRVLELAIDRPAELFVQADTIRGSALRFVEAEGSAGVGEELGVGSVTVECDGFAPGLPEGYDVS